MSAPPPPPPEAFPPEYLAEDRRPQTIVGMSVAALVAGVVVLTRIYARWRWLQKFGLDDALICIAMVMSLVLLAIMIMVLHYGAGRHLASLDPSNAAPLYKWLVAGQLVYMLNLYVCRLSGLAFYARLNSMPRYVLYLKISFGFITAVYIAQTLIIALQCIPLSTLWGAANGKCVSLLVVNIVTATLTLICDSLVLLLPINIILTMKATLSRKVALGIVLCFGVFAVITSVLRMVSMLPVVNEPNDATWYFSVVLAWSSAEISAAIVALSLPALKALFRSITNEKSSTGNSNSRSSRSRSRSGEILMKTLPPGGKNHRDANGFLATVESARSTSEEALWTTPSGNKNIRGYM